ncbi:MAG: hypothetical protein J7513_18090, partial [Solirubrobacteraceae bacterium]|nr:hypothetical protein [Solirubrobacteraceae bacterium]
MGAIAELREQTGPDSDPYAAYWELVSVLEWRSGPVMLERAIELTASADRYEREVGVDLLGRLRGPGFREADES